MINIRTLFTKSIIGLCLMAGGAMSPIHALTPDNPNSEEFKKNAAANRGRIEQQLKANGSKADIAWFSVIPMSDIMRNGDVWPTDGELNGTLRVVLAQDEYEPASFQLFSFKNRKNVTFTIPNLKNKEGDVLTADKLDLKVVKIWYQNGNGWHSYFQDIGLRLIPELLVYDENLIKVDTKKEANYARIREDKGERYQWISAPIELDKSPAYHKPDVFNPREFPGFADAKTLQPVVLEANQFKQFFLTVYAEKGQKPGIYEGVIAVNENGSKILDIPVAVRVLPFELPLAKSYNDLDRPVIASAMGMMGMKLDDKDFRDILINFKKHNMIHPIFNFDADSEEKVIALMKELGYPLDTFMGGIKGIGWLGHGTRLTYDQLMEIQKAAQLTKEFYEKNLGHSNVLVTYGDEAGPLWIVAMRDWFRYFDELGMQVGTAGHQHMFYKGAYAWGWHNMGGPPEKVDYIKQWRSVGNNIGFYAGQHTGVENPSFVRRQNGLLGYMNGLNIIYNYHFDPLGWNDLSHGLYRPMTIAYLSGDGLVDTLQWEAYREAVDDMRYATKLQQLIQEALASGNIDRKQEAKKALQYFALLDTQKADLNTVRMEMIEYILKLLALAK
jgi:hypothetical protein